MAFTEKRLSGPVAVSNFTQTLLYTCPTASTTTTLVKQVMLTNTSSSESKQVYLILVPSGSSTENSNQILAGMSVLATDTMIIDLSQVMSSGDFLTIYVYGSSGSLLNVTISGVENAGAMVVSGLADSAVTTAKIADSNITAAKLGPNAFLSNAQAGAIMLMEMM